MNKAPTRKAIKLAGKILADMDWQDYPAPAWCKLCRVCPNCHDTVTVKANCTGCQWLRK